MRRTVQDVMTRDVVVTKDSTSFKNVVRHLRAAGVSAIPVVDAEGRLVGIVSEDDLLPKEERASAGKRRALGRERRIDRRKAEALTVRDLMTSAVITIGPGDTLATAARRMHDHHVKRLPVVDADRQVIGIVSRQDLIKVFLRPDDQIRDEVVHDVIQRALWLDPHSIRVDVEDGVVTLEGRLEKKSLIEILVGLVHGVDGVVGVVPRLSFDVDDSRARAGLTLPWGILPASLRYPSHPSRRTG